MGLSLLTITFSSTFVLCEVIVSPPCSLQSGDDLVRCVQQLINSRCAVDWGLVGRQRLTCDPLQRIHTCRCWLACSARDSVGMT